MDKHIKHSRCRILILLLIAFLAFCSSSLYAQDNSDNDKEKNNKPKEKVFKMGLHLGVSINNHSLLLKDNYQEIEYQHEEAVRILGPLGILNFSEEQLGCFRYENVETHKVMPGFSLGVVGDIRLTDYLSLQFVPTISAKIEYIKYDIRLYDKNNQPYTNYLGEDESHRTIVWDGKNDFFFEMPLLVNYQFNRVYVVGGINPKVNLAYRPIAFKTGLTTPFDLALEVGAGFKATQRIGIQVKLDIGLMNILNKEQIILINNINGEYQSINCPFYATPIESLKNNQLQVSFVFL